MELDNMGGVIALLAVILVFGTPIVIVIAILVHRARRTRAIHETVLRLAEKGLPIPPEIFADRQWHPDEARSSLQKGVILVAVGIGLIGFFLTLSDRHAPWGVGIIPLLIGAGYLVVWRIEGRRAQDATRAERTAAEREQRT